MTLTIRAAGLRDLEPIADLLLVDAEARCATAPELWKLEGDPRGKILSAVRAALEAENPVLRHQWLVAEVGGSIVGVTHAMILPVPPIYAGELGPPGLIMEDCFVSAAAPPETRRRLLRATEVDLVKAGARLLLASSVAGGDWEDEYRQDGFDPVTQYFAKTDLSESHASPHIRKAREGDVPAIVASSAVNRKILAMLHPIFWKPHVEADKRFGGWMSHSLTLADRDMFVSEQGGKFEGYAISQPATWLHFPTSHDISAVGVIDDYFHEDIGEIQGGSLQSVKAMALLEAAETARQRRGATSVLAVCPALWRSKIALLEAAGYTKAITWFIKIDG